eukprot:4026186-Prorocentrum_lima.AAC.1
MLLGSSHRNDGLFSTGLNFLINLYRSFFDFATFLPHHLCFTLPPLVALERPTNPPIINLLTYLVPPEPRVGRFPRELSGPNLE